MACTIDSARKRRRLDYTLLDERLLAKAHAFAANAGMEIGDFIDSALTFFMHNLEMDGANSAVKTEWCAEHHCCLETNSSGTALACPVTEGSPDSAFYDRPKYCHYCHRPVAIGIVVTLPDTQEVIHICADCTKKTTDGRTTNLVRAFNPDTDRIID